MLMFLELSPILTPLLDAFILQRDSSILKGISRRNRDKFEQGTETIQFRNRKEELIQRLQRRHMTGESFEQATSVIGRQRLLMSIYLERFGQQTAVNTWLPAFDNRVASSILGGNGADWNSRRRRQATLLFFTFFDHLAALPNLCARLCEAYVLAADNQSENIHHWRIHRQIIFAPAGPDNVSGKALPSENLEQLMVRFNIPGHGRFASKLRQVFLLSKLKTVHLGTVIEAFAEIEKVKNEPAPDNLVMGAAALKIIVGRVMHQGKGKWPDDWRGWIIRLGCDPRYGRASAEGAKWWTWASNAEFSLAQAGIIGLQLKFFIDYLKTSLIGTPIASQFALRSRFLLALFETGRIKDARLVFNNYALRRLDHKYHDPWWIAHLTATTNQTSMICLRFSDDIYLIEGTHSFRLRIFHKEFPISGFWERQRNSFHDKELRISPADCSFSLPHDHSGHWVSKFFKELRERFHKEWGDVRL